MLLETSARGAMMMRRVEEATTSIESLPTNDYQAPYDRNTFQKSNTKAMNVGCYIDIEKLISQQMEELEKYMAKLQLESRARGLMQQILKRDLCVGEHHNDHCSTAETA
ncbi:hypothetical protein V8G54_012502 [Vigna mungo]|uniref:Uncharacterized protein n=1 Tax=Vigna mungo TaxID=3915 RepID=A0AAQ3NRB3_VIGMU